MALKSYEETDIQNIANSIRGKNGETTKYKVSEMSTAIDNISGGGNLQTKSVSITENGTSTISPDEGYDGLEKVDLTVSVSGGGSTNKVKPMSISFQNFSGETIDLTNLDMSLLTSAKNMFSSIKVSGEINMGDTDTSTNVTNMSYMFSNAKAPNINISFPKGFGSACTNMSFMFGNNSFADTDYFSFKAIDLSNFDTLNVTNMSNMFGGTESVLFTTIIYPMACGKITFPKNFGSSCTDMSSMFKYFSYNSSGSRQLDLSNFNTSNVTSMKNMFYYTRYIAVLDLSSFDFTNVTSYTSMFASCGTWATKGDGAYAYGIPYVYVKDETAQAWVIARASESSLSWTTDNVIVKEA